MRGHVHHSDINTAHVGASLKNDQPGRGCLVDGCLNRERLAPNLRHDRIVR